MFCKGCKALIKDEYAFCPVCGKATKPAPRIRKYRPKGSGSVRKLPGNRKRPYQARKDGVSLGTFETEMAASLCLLQYQEKTVTQLDNITLGQLYERWKTTDWYLKLSKDMQNNYKAAWKRLSMHQHQRIKDLKTSHYQMAIDKVKSEGLQRDSCEKLRSLISVLCQYAMSDDIIDRNYSEGLQLPEKVKSIKRNFTDEEILTLFYNDHIPDACIVLCLLYTGMRESEFFSIKKSDVTLGNVPYMVGGSKTEGGRNRVIPIRSEIVDYITNFYKTTPGEYLICTSTGKKIDRNNFIKRQFYPLLDKLKIQYKDETGKNVLTPHRTRHTFIAENIKAGVKPEVLTKVVGHSNYSTSVDKYNTYIDIEYILHEMQKGL